jgi:hypothetical protein
VTTQLTVAWPDPTIFVGGRGSLRILAMSDELDPALEDERNRARLAPIDLIVGCGDLDADELCFVADAFRAPLVYILGNHDRGGRWTQGADRLPSPLGPLTDELGLTLVGFSWPGLDHPGPHARRDEVAAWGQVLGLSTRLLARRLRSARASPLLIVSHAPPRGLGDGPDAYHAGFDGYRWLVERLRPPLWLHGHTHPATTDARVVRAGATIVSNVTGSVLFELRPPAAVRAAAAPTDRPPR